MQRSLPAPDQYGNWDKLPKEIEVNDSVTDSFVLDMVVRRDILTAMHSNTKLGDNEPGRSWSLRQNHEGVSFINMRIKHALDSLTQG